MQAVQSPYNLFERAIEGDVLPYCRDKNIVTLETKCEKQTGETTLTGESVVMILE